MEILDKYNEDIFEINLTMSKISGPLDFSKFKNLKRLSCSLNQITKLDNLPNTLITLSCQNNCITELYIPNNNIKNLYCDDQVIIHIVK